LHLAASEGTEALYTFDERFIRKGSEAVPPVLGVPEGSGRAKELVTEIERRPHVGRLL
jgi:hypothetical protein